MSDDERKPDEAEPEGRAEDHEDESEVEAHSLPQPPPRSMNGL